MEVRIITTAIPALFGSIFGLPAANAQVAEPNLAISTFYYSGQEKIWVKPPEVTHAIISACGGGGGGGGGEQGSAGNFAGSGGEAAAFDTIIVELTATTYKVRVGFGGVSNRDGSPTTFIADDSSLSLYFFGGLVGQPMGDNSNEGGEGLPGIFGGGGIPGAFATGAEHSGGAATAHCAGGGGAARQGLAIGGKGGNGYLAILPVPDLARFARVLGALETLSAPPKVVIEENGDSGGGE